MKSITQKLNITKKGGICLKVPKQLSLMTGVIEASKIMPDNAEKHKGKRFRLQRYRVL